MNTQTLCLFLLLTVISQCSSFNITWSEYLKRFPESHVNALSSFHFGENVKFIIQQNSMGYSYKLGLTPFLHLSEVEWRSRFNNISLDRSENVVEHVSSLRGTPSSWNWIDQGVTTPVKDQGQCGSCWAFSSTEAVETAYAIKSGKLLVLSPQQLVDCSKTNSGCNGGLQNRAFKYLEKTPQCTESSYPYTAKDGTCHDCTGVVPKLVSYVSVKADETEMASALLVTSLAVAIEADQKQFQAYTSGVLDFDCGTNLDHAVNIEGMGTEDGKDYWLVRNSWSADWGDKGYIKMARGKNLCGIKESVVYPVF